MAITGDNSIFKFKMRRDLIDSFIKGFGHASYDNYFMFMGKCDGWTADEEVPVLSDSWNTDSDIWRNIIAIKQITESDIFFLTPKYTWTNNTVYTMYDDLRDLTDKEYYVLNGEYNVYKCISNNYNSTSSVEPTGIKTDGLIKLSDGYLWKYMFTIPEPHRYYINDDVFPVALRKAKGSNTESHNQWDVQNNAITGIEFIYVDNTVSYNLTEEVAFPYKPDTRKLGDVSLKGSDFLYLNSTDSKGSDDYYNNLVITIKSGIGVGQRRTITDYDSATNKVSLDSPLSSYCNQGDAYEIAPAVTIYGDGISASAYIDLNPYDADNENNRTIREVVITNNGTDYSNASVFLTPNTMSFYDDEPAGIRPIISPEGGHGKNATQELICDSLLIVVNTDQRESGDFIVTNDVRQYGILKNPILNDTDPEYLDKNGKPYRIAGSETPKTAIVEVTPSSVNGFLHDELFTVGKYVLGNDTHSTGKIEDWSSALDDRHGLLTLSDIRGVFDAPEDDSKTGEGLIEYYKDIDSGWTFNTAQITEVSGFDKIYRNNPATYNCTWGIGISGEGLNADSFPSDSSITGGDGISLDYNNPTGLVVDWTNNIGGTGGTLTASNVSGTFEINELIGSSTEESTELIINNLVIPEIKPYSGSIIYAQNMKPIERDPEQREQYQIILKF